MATKTFGAANKKWSEEGAWEPIGVPGVGDDVVFNASSGKCTVGSTAAKCRSLNAENYKGELIFTTGKIAVGTSTSPEGNIGIKLGSEAKLSATANFSIVATTGSGTEKLYFGGQTPEQFTVAGTGAKCQLEEPLKAKIIGLTKGELKTNGQTVTVSQVFETSGTATRVLNLGASMVKLTSEGGTAWNFGETTGLTLTAGSSTIEVTDAEVFRKGFDGGGLTYGTLTAAGQFIEVSGSNTFATINNNTAKAVLQTIKATLSGTTLTKTEGAQIWVGQEVRGTAIPTGTIITEIKSPTEYTMSASATEVVGTPENVEVFAQGLIFREGTLQTVTSFTSNGKSGELARLSAAETSAKPQPLAAAKIKAAGLISTDYMTIAWSKAETGEFYAGANSLDKGNNTGWKFEAAPAAGLVNAQSMVI